ncbi:MAG: hypothetical protein EHM58_08640 [Ignavibacteriae bacterium]|nr:MAG: hypothetical protein EHM58_08640 [Ignavibacteriota bacterium]
MKSIYLLILLFILFSSAIYGQDTAKVTGPSDSGRVTIRSDSLRAINPEDTVRIPPPFIANYKYQYINISNPDTISRSRFLWMPLKVFEDVANYLPGYFLNFMDAGQVNRMNYNQLDQHYTALLRHGRPLNDLFDGSLDMNLLSRNEISVLELSNGFGNSLYNYANNINIIQRQLFRFTPYSEISYYDDRYENIFLDGNFHMNFSRYLNFNFGITKHSYDGKYINSDFDKWLGRFNFNYIGSKKFNAFLYLNYSRIQRGLNEGLYPVTLPGTDKTSLYEASTYVNNPDAYEIRERFDVDAGGIFTYGKNENSFTKFQLFVSNSFRKYRDEENRGQFQPLNGIYIKDNIHWINYGAKVIQNFDIPLTKKVNLNSRTEAEVDLDIIFANTFYYTKQESNRQFLLQELNLNYGKYNVGGYVKLSKYAYASDKYYFNYGSKILFNVFSDSSTGLNLFANYSFMRRLPEYGEYSPLWGDIEKVHSLLGGFDFRFNFGNLRAEYYYNSRLQHIVRLDVISSMIDLNNYYNTSGINTKLFLKLWKFEIDGTYQYNILPGEGTEVSRDNNYYPKHSGNVMLSYHSQHLNNKLEIQIGVNSRFWTTFIAPVYNGHNNEFYNRFNKIVQQTPYIAVYSVTDKATLDFFISGRISKAIFGITFENIINRPAVTTAIYPNQQRGGLANVLSRFNVTWYFLN